MAAHPIHELSIKAGHHNKGGGTVNVQSCQSRDASVILTNSEYNP